MRFAAASLLALIVLGAPAVLAAPAAAPVQTPPAAPAADKAPGFVLPDAAGQYFFLSKNVGQSVLVLYFAAEYCAACKKLMPLIMDLKARQKEAPWRLLVLSQDTEGLPLLAEFKKNKWEIAALLNDGFGNAAEKYRIKKLPGLVVVDRAGQIRLRETGFKEDTLSRLESVLAELTAP